MIRRATEADMPRLATIRAAVRENRLSDPSLVTPSDVRWFIAHPGIFVREVAGEVVGFSAADPRDCSIWALFVDPAHEGRGIGQALFARACAVLTEAGCPQMRLTTGPGTRAEAFYRAAGWQVCAIRGGQLVFARTTERMPG